MDREAIILAHMPLVRKLGKSFGRTNDDLVTALTLRLVQAVDRALALKVKDLSAFLKADLKIEVVNFIRAELRFQRSQRPSGGLKRDVRGNTFLETKPREEEDLSELLKGLDPFERRILQFRMAGHSWKEVSSLTGWSQAKISRAVRQMQEKIPHAAS